MNKLKERWVLNSGEEKGDWKCVWCDYVIHNDCSSSSSGKDDEVRNTLTWAAGREETGVKDESICIGN